MQILKNIFRSKNYKYFLKIKSIKSLIDIWKTLFSYKN